MRRAKIKAENMGRYSLNYNNQNIKSSVYLDINYGYFIMVKGNRIPITRVDKNKYITSN